MKTTAPGPPVVPMTERGAVGQSYAGVERAPTADPARTATGETTPAAPVHRSMTDGSAAGPNGIVAKCFPNLSGGRPTRRV